MEHTSRLIRDLYQIVARLEEAFPGRRFTPDGHLVGSLGEVFAAERYGLTLLEGLGGRRPNVEERAAADLNLLPTIPHGQRPRLRANTGMPLGDRPVGTLSLSSPGAWSCSGIRSSWSSRRRASTLREPRSPPWST